MFVMLGFNILYSNKRLQGYVWYQDDISLIEHSLFGPLKFVTTGINKLKYPIMINKKQWKALEK